MSTKAVQLVVSVSCQLPVNTAAGEVASCQCQVPVETATDALQ
jgi:hypothetical protein